MLLKHILYTLFYLFLLC